MTVLRFCRSGLMEKKRLAYRWLLLLVGAVFLLSACRRETFTGVRVKEADAYRMEAAYLNGHDRHTMELNEGDVLQICFETEGGTMKLEILAPDGRLLYSGNGTEVTDFSLRISQGGTHTVAVSGARAKGTISVCRKGDASVG